MSVGGIPNSKEVWICKVDINYRFFFVQALWQSTKYTCKVQKYTFNVQKRTFKVQKYTFNVHLYFQRTKIYLQSTKVYFRSTKIYLQSTKVYFRSTKIVFQSTKVYFRSTKIVFQSTKVYFQSTPVYFQSTQVQFQRARVYFQSTKVYLRNRVPFGTLGTESPEPGTFSIPRVPQKRFRPNGNETYNPSTRNRFPAPGSFTEPPQLAQNTPKSILCKDPNKAFCCWGKSLKSPWSDHELWLVVLCCI